MGTQLDLKFIKCPVIFFTFRDFVIICVIQYGLSEHLIQASFTVVLPAQLSELCDISIKIIDMTRHG